MPFLHLADATARAVVGTGLEQVALLGTRYTMEQDFYRSRLERHGLAVIVPDEPDRTLAPELDALVQPLRDDHRALGAEAQLASACGGQPHKVRLCRTGDQDGVGVLLEEGLEACLDRACAWAEARWGWPMKAGSRSSTGMPFSRAAPATSPRVNSRLPRL